MFRVTCLKILGIVGTHVFFIIFLLEENIILCLLKGISHVHLKRILGFTSKFTKVGQVILNTGIFYVA